MYLAFSNHCQLKQMDMKTAYLNAPIEKDVLIKQPEAFELYMNLHEKRKPFIFILKKNLRGLKPSGRNWFLTKKSFLITLGFVNSFHDKCLFTKKQYEKINNFLFFAVR